MFAYAKAVRPDEVNDIQEEFSKLYIDRPNMAFAQAKHPEPGLSYLIWISGREVVLPSFLHFLDGERVRPLLKDASLLCGNPDIFRQFFAEA